MQSVDTTSAVEVGIERMQWSRRFLESLLASLTDQQLLARAGGAGNHALWVMGHVAVSEDQLMAMISGRAPTLPQRFQDLFAGGTEPRSSASEYPSRAELADAMRSTRQAAIEWFRSRSEAELDAQTPEMLRPFAPDVRTMPMALCGHEMIHTGQVAAVRSSLGLPKILR